MTTHARLSPSGAHRWMPCPASVPMESVQPDTSSEFADEGTAAHELAALALNTGNDAADYIDKNFTVNGKDYKVGPEMAGYVQQYIDFVRGCRGDAGMLSVEQRLDVSSLTEEEDAGGTSDAVLLVDDELIIADLKYGRGVKVFAQDNPQLMIYALAAMREYELLADIKRVRMVIVQPRLDHIDEWECSPVALELFANQVKESARSCRAAVAYFEKYDAVHVKYFAPGEKQCQFCRAKAKCPSLASHVTSTVADDFVDMTQPVAPQIEEAALRIVDNQTLGNLMGAVDLVEGWCKAIRAKVEAELIRGDEIPGWKLVEGRKGARQWTDETEAEATLKKMRIKTADMYSMKLITPTTAEKLHKANVIGTRQWPVLQALITQSEGKPSVAPESDKRPAYCAAAKPEEFSDVTGNMEDLL